MYVMVVRVLQLSLTTKKKKQTNQTKTYTSQWKPKNSVAVMEGPSEEGVQENNEGVREGSPASGGNAITNFAGYFALPVTMLADITRLSTTKPQSMLLRVHQRSEELRKFFRLPKGESLLEEFHCALKKTFLFQGRMHVFERYICFYANVFGIVKKRIIPITDVREVVRKRHYGFPNSIQIMTVDNKLDFFTSFIARDEAFQLILTTWKQIKSNRSYSSEFAQSSRDSTNNTQDEEIQPKQHTRSITYDYGADSSQPQTIFEMRGTDQISPSDQYQEDDEEDQEDTDEDAELTPENWQFFNKEAPEIHDQMQLLIDVELKLSTVGFAAEILSDTSSVFHEYHNQRGDRNLHITPWKKTPAIGHVRDLIFVSQVTSRVGPSQTSCSQIQRASFYREEHLVFETSQVMSDIPFGDSFTVETRWDLVNLDSNTCRLTIHCHIPFSKKIMWRRIIESSAIKELDQSLKQFVEIMQKRIEQVNQVPEELAPMLSARSNLIAQAPSPVNTQEAVPKPPTPEPNVDKQDEETSTTTTYKLSIIEYLYLINAQFKEFGLMILVIISMLALLLLVMNVVVQRKGGVGEEAPSALVTTLSGVSEQHVSMLQMELRLLQERLEIMSKEVQILKAQLGSIP
eukprot:TRINITY_DN3100_c0_g1_i12.p1 TRINITY_DN3100_c0_g1~~TRINITY_DN3100_c0_g1_i12.p1  ORF type:complete len:629 (-),score=76.10 TRINITY_DN3100_c0_g1_i12:220-2106(-)